MDKTAEYAQAAALYKQALSEGADPAEAQSAYNAAVSAIAARPDPVSEAPATAGNITEEPGAWDKVKGVIGSSLANSPLGMAGRAVGALAKARGGETESNARGAAATALHGMSFGLADDFAGGNMGESMRQDAANFHGAHPYIGTGTEIAGNVLSGSGLASLGKQGIPYVSKAADVLSKSALGQGALAGYGSSESDTQGGRLLDGAVGGVIGGLAAKAAGLVGRGVAGTASRIADKLDGLTPLSPAYRARAALAGAVQHTPGGMEGMEAINGVNSASGATLMDDLGGTGVRMARGIRANGGEGAEVIDNAMNTRQRSYADKITDAFRNGKVFKTGMQTMDDISATQKAMSDPLYEAFEQEPAKHIPEVEALLKRPLFQKAVARAERFNANEGIAKSMLVEGDGAVPLRTPRDFDRIKKALDGVIELGRRASNSDDALTREELGQASKWRQEFVDLIDKNYKNYKTARDAWAGDAALKDALQEGMDAAKGSVPAEEIAKKVAKMGASEKEMFAHGFADDVRRQVENGGMKPGKTEQTGMIKRIEAVFGDDANNILTRLRDEVQAHRNAGTIRGGSQTTDKGADMFSELVPEEGTSLARSILTPYGRVNFFDRLTRKNVSEPMGAGAREQAAKMLLSPADETDILKKIAAEIKAQKFGQKVGQKIQGPLAAELNYGFFRRPPEQR